MGRAVRLRADGPEPKSSWLDAVLLTAIVGSVFPDLDVIPGLTIGRSASDLHRGATHSPLGLLVQAPLIAMAVQFVWRRAFGESLSLRILFWSALAGLSTHAFWDSLNPWGISPFWPWGDKSPGNLVHEGDVWVLGTLIASSILVTLGRYRWGYGLCLAFIVGYGLFQYQWRSTIQERAEQEVEAELVETYPNGQLDCPWVVLARLHDAMQAFCASKPRSGDRRLVLEVPIVRDELIGASEKRKEVVKYKQNRSFPFAAVRRARDGSATVIWRDLREAVLERESKEPSGLYVQFSPTGEIISADMKWLLRFWFW